MKCPAALYCVLAMTLAGAMGVTYLALGVRAPWVGSLLGLMAGFAAASLFFLGWETIHHHSAGIASHTRTSGTVP